MRTSEIHIGSQYKVRRWNKRVTIAHRTKTLSSGIGFNAHWSYWVATVVGREGRRYVIEWSEAAPLHDLKAQMAWPWAVARMKWTTQVVQDTVTPSQIIEKVG